MPTEVLHNDPKLVEEAIGQRIIAMKSAPELSDNAPKGGTSQLTEMTFESGISVVAKYDEEAKTPYFELSKPTPTKGVGSKAS